MLGIYRSIKRNTGDYHINKYGPKTRVAARNMLRQQFVDTKNVARREAEGTAT